MIAHPHVTARLMTNDALDRAHAAWLASAPAPEVPYLEQRHTADRRALARWYDAGRRAGDAGRQRADLADCA